MEVNIIFNIHQIKSIAIREQTSPIIILLILYDRENAIRYDLIR